MNAPMVVCCPNCGSRAYRHFLSDRQLNCCKCPDNQVVQTECPVCDYLMVMCWQNGRVIEAYVSGRQAVTHTSVTHQVPYLLHPEPTSTSPKAIDLVPVSSAVMTANENTSRELHNNF